MSYYAFNTRHFSLASGLLLFQIKSFHYFVFLFATCLALALSHMSQEGSVIATGGTVIPGSLVTLLVFPCAGLQRGTLVGISSAEVIIRPQMSWMLLVCEEDVYGWRMALGGVT